MLPAERRPPSRLDQRTCREERRCADTAPKNDRSDPGGSLQSPLQAKAEAIPASTRGQVDCFVAYTPLRKRAAFVAGKDAERATFHRAVRKAKTYSVIARARHRDSKLLSSSSIRACASMGSPLFSMATLTGATLTGATPTGATPRAPRAPWLAPAPLRATSAPISRSRFCRRTSIFVHRSGARTNAHVPLTGARHCIPWPARPAR